VGVGEVRKNMTMTLYSLCEKKKKKLTIEQGKIIQNSAK
jgi:hypothetical protein